MEEMQMVIVIGIIVIICLLIFITIKQSKIMATQEEGAVQLGNILTQMQKANTEIQAKIQALVDAAANADTVNPTLQAAIDALVPAAQALDDIVPDVAG